jgi:hypothetical protein
MANIFNICSILLVAALLLFACLPGTATQPVDQTVLEPEPSPIESPNLPEPERIIPTTPQSTLEVEEDYPEAVLAAIEDLALQLEISPKQVQVISFQDEEWPDSCLGLAAPDEMCLQVITPGFRILLNANGMHFEYHSDLTGDILRVSGDNKVGLIRPKFNSDESRAVLTAIQAINQSTGTSTNEIKIISIEVVEWSDSCLGLARSDEMCAEVITPGWIIILEADGKTYEYHTDLSGENIRLK